MTYSLYPHAAPDPEPQAEAVPGPEPAPEPTPEPKPSRKRLWITIGATAAAMLVLAGLIGGMLVFHATADRYHRKADAETQRADGLSADLASTKESLVATQHDLTSTRSQLNDAQADLTRSQDFSNKAAAVGAKFDRCVQDTGTFLERLDAMLSAFPYGYDPTLSSYGDQVGSECADARASFYALGIGAT